MKLAWVGVAAALALVGCKQNTQDANQDLAQERQEANQELSELRQDAAQERQEITQDVREEEANVRQDLAEAQRDVRESEYQGEGTQARQGTGGSGELAASGTVVGVVKSASDDSVTIQDQAGNEHEFKADASTTVTMNGQASKLENISEGAEVRASFSTEGSDKVVKDVTVTKQKDEANEMK